MEPTRTAAVLSMSEDAITKWIDELKKGDPEAVEKLWQRYFHQIVHVARKRLEGAKRSVADEEDVALSVFKSFWRGAQEGRFPALTDRDSLWSLLVAITAHKAIDQIRRDNRVKRGGTGKPPNGLECNEKLGLIPLSEVIRNEPTPELVVQLKDQLAFLLEKLKDADDPELMQIALAKMSGDSNVEIAQQIGCARRTIERKLAVIRRVWEQALE